MRKTLFTLGLGLILSLPAQAQEQVFLPGNVEGKLTPLKTETKEVEVYQLTVKRGREKDTFKVYRIGELYFAEPTAMVKRGNFFLPLPDSLKREISPLTEEELDRLKEAAAEFYEEAGIREVKNGKEPLYIVFDPLCPFCEKAAREGKMEELSKRFDLKFLPLPVHGQVSERITACLLFLAKEKKEPFEAVIKEWFSSLPEKKQALLKECEGKDLKREYLVENKLSKSLEDLKIVWTPTFIYSDGKVQVGAGNGKGED